MNNKILLSAFSLKPLLLALGLLCSASVMAGPEIIELTQTESASAEPSKAEIEALFQESFKGKTLPQIKIMLNEQIEELESLQKFNSIRLSVGSAEDDNEVQHTSKFTPMSASAFETLFNQYFASLEPRQQIAGKSSYVSTNFRNYDFSELSADYEVFDYEPVTIMIERVHFKDGSSALPAEVIDKGEIKVASAGRVVSVDMVATYTLPDSVKHFDFKTKENASQNEISLVSINGREVTLTMPEAVYNNILHVEAIDKNGEPLKDAGSSSYYNDAYYVDKLHQYFTDAIKQLDNDKITERDSLIKYLANNYPSKKEANKAHPPKYTASYRFHGNPVSVTVFLKPEAKKYTYNFTLTMPDTAYNNGLAVAANESEKPLYGLVDEQGNWLIPPQYIRLDRQVGDYYYAVGAKGDYNDGKIYLLNRTAKKLELQPFYLMNEKVIKDKFLIVNKEQNNNFIQGLVNIQTHQILLPLKYHGIEVTGSLFIASNFDDKRNIRSYEVYRQSDNKQVLRGDFNDFYVDGDNIIVRHEMRTTKKEGDTPYYAIENDNVYIYHNFDIYNADGVRLNAKSYAQLPSEMSFGKDGLMPVIDKQDKSYYVDRQAKKVNFDLSGYKNIKPFSNGLAAVQGEDGQYGYINTQGKLVIPLMYESANFFQGGTALVETSEGYQLITPKNKVVAQFKDISIRTYSLIQDAQEATYTFINYQTDEFFTYDQQGKPITKEKSGN
ncbi:WG repeat-containing protein [Serratia sp. DD3]|uniref:WG repeat-containing protein n=1 Tax=Serratia sp. DD3 TaxID=1410619 RepID=UPI0003C51CCB|nr:WG repeat-containing protein [Serratia sp. DD3]KEY59315.1 KWG leptospira [Serratia sp. DD3]